MLLVIFCEGAAGLVFAVTVEGKNASEKGWVVPGVAEEVVGEGLVSVFVVDGGGVDGAAFGVEGTVATVRMDRWRVLEGWERRARSVLLQLVQIMVVVWPRDRGEGVEMSWYRYLGWTPVDWMVFEEKARKS
ncbi:hypothetical protein ES702_05932 [subsurface metagenome]